MSRIAIYDPNDVVVANRIIKYLLSADINIERAKDPNVLNNPKVPAVDFKYWKKSGDDVGEMTNTEKAAVDQAEADAEAQKEADEKNIDLIAKHTKVLAVLTFEEINKLRKNAGLSEYTWAQFKTAYVNAWNSIN